MSHRFPLAPFARSSASVDWGRTGALAVLESGLIVESLSLSPNADYWQRNYKAVRLALKRAAHIFSSFEASDSDNLARVSNQAKSLR